MDKVFLRNLHIQMIIGVHEWERGTPQEVIVSVCLHADTRKPGFTDDIRDCIDYSKVASEIRQQAAHSHKFTVEAFANEIAQICLEKYPVEKVVVRVEKPSALPEAESVGVEISRP